MSLKQDQYQNVRDRMQPGDVVAFGGKGDFSQIIKWATRSTVSHVGVILQSKLVIGDEPQEGFFNQIIESTQLEDFSGVTISRLSDRLKAYEGEIWWLPLGQACRQRLNFKAFYDFLLHQNKKAYDMPQAIKSALDALDNFTGQGHFTHNKEDYERFFCSELVSAGLEAGGVIGDINSSEVTPIDLCCFNLYDAEYYQIKGDKPVAISGYNSVSPEGWGQ